MEWLNYHHLQYFWTVAKEGTIAAACEKLNVAQPTISAQIRALEKSVGEKLFRKTGRNLVLTDIGRVVYRYADDIFSIGNELLDTLNDRPTGRPIKFSVGVAETLPKLVVYKLLEPTLHLPERIQLFCREGNTTELIADLAVHELDIVLSDSPIGPDLKVRAYNHLLGECGVSILGTEKLASSCRPNFPHSLDGMPILLPSRNTALRRSLDQWFEQKDIHPIMVGEFADRALLKEFGQAGVGVFATPTIIENQIKRQYKVEKIGRLDEVRDKFYAISVERKVKHPAVVAIADSARKTLFEPSGFN